MDDPFDLARFVTAQDTGRWPAPLEELRAGRKRGHWIWYVLPQLEGLGASERSRAYGIGSLDEARAYAAHPVLGPRLRACLEALEDCAATRAEDVMGSGLDAVKLRSCLTLFERADPLEPIHGVLLARWFGGVRDPLTLARLGPDRPAGPEPA